MKKLLRQTTLESAHLPVVDSKIADFRKASIKEKRAVSGNEVVPHYKRMLVGKKRVLTLTIKQHTRYNSLNRDFDVMHESKTKARSRT